jgi:hypothetical protein
MDASYRLRAHDQVLRTEMAAMEQRLIVAASRIVPSG